MIKSVKVTNHNKSWTKDDLKNLKVMIKSGLTTKEIAKVMGRTAHAVGYQRTLLSKGSNDRVSSKVRSEVAKAVKNVKVSKPSKVVKVVKESSVASPAGMRDAAKDMASAARQIARANGKRITMAMFFIEDID